MICIGAGGLVSHIAPSLVRKGIGTLAVLDDDLVEVSNLNRQKFYRKDLGQSKAIALVENLQQECIANTQLAGYAMTFEEACEKGINLACDVAVCGVDNNPARVATSRYFRQARIPVIFVAVSAGADHGYVFIQEAKGPCLGCLFPDLADSRTFPCPGTPAITDILQVVGALAVYAVDTCLMNRPRLWNYRRILLSDGSWDSCQTVDMRSDCSLTTMH